MSVSRPTTVLEPPALKRAKIKHFWAGVGPFMDQPPPPGTPALCGYVPPGDRVPRPSNKSIHPNRCVVCIERAREIGAL